MVALLIKHSSIYRLPKISK